MQRFLFLVYVLATALTSAAYAAPCPMTGAAALQQEHTTHAHMADMPASMAAHHAMSLAECWQASATVPPAVAPLPTVTPLVTALQPTALPAAPVLRFRPVITRAFPKEPLWLTTQRLRI